MKTKLLGKITLLAFVLMVTLSFGSISPMLATVSAATTIESAGDTGYIIELTGYQSSYDLDDTEDFGDATGYKLPTPVVKSWTGSTTQVESGVNVDVTVTSSSGREVAVAESGSDRFIQVGKSDRYTVTYTATNESGVVTATRNVTIDITAQDAEFEFDSNSPQIMPTVVEAGDKIVFPWPRVSFGDDQYATEPNITITLEGPTKANEGATSAVTSRELGNQVIDNVNYKTYTVTENDTGTFTVTYTYDNSGTDIVEKFTFNVVTTAPEVDLAYSGWSSSIENLSLSVGQEAPLPTPTVINTAQSNVTVSNVYTEITIVNLTTNKTYPVITDFKFTPDEDGDYRITYVTKDFTGAVVSYTTLKSHVRKTGDSITIKVVDDYSDKVTVDGEGNTTIDSSMADINDVENADYAIPSNVYLVGGKATVTFPAIYATAGWGDYDNLHLTRQIYRRNSSQQVLELQQKPNSSETYKAYEEAPYTFTSEGEYSIRYIAYYVDNEGKEITGTTRQLSFSFTVHDVDAEPTIDLSITAPNVTKATRKGSTITFSAPTATSVISGTNEVADANIKIDVRYRFNYGTDYSDYYTAELNDDNLYEIKIEMPEGMEESQWNTVSSLEISFEAIDDFCDGVPATAVRTVSIVDFSADNTAPQLTAFDASVDSSEAGILTLPTVTFTDDNSSISLVAYVLKGNSVMRVINANTGDTATIQGATYTPTEEGTYTVTYVATDQNNNISTISVNYKVDFHNGYSVSIDNISAQQYGTVINLLDYINVTDHGTAIDMADMTVRVVQEEVTQEFLNSAESMPNNTLIIYVSGDFQFPIADRIDGEIVTLEGDVTVRAWAKDSEGVCDYTQNGSSAITFTTSDSTNPTFTIEDESLDGSNYEFTDSTADNEITLPWFDRVIDNESGINPDTMKIEVYYQDTPDEIIHTFTSANIDALKFTPNRQGKITAEYSVSDMIGNTYTRTFTLNIGDVTPPEIVLNDGAITADNYVGGKLTIDLNNFDIDNDALDPLEDIAITITRDGTDVEFSRDSENRNIIEITLDTAGTYVVTFDTEDTAGNQAQTVTRTYNISAQSTTPTNTATIWGTILIIVALIVLGLVIFFFVKPSKSKVSAPKTTTKKDEDSKKNK